MQNFIHFGAFSFQIRGGLKQDYVLSPSLFNIVMADLDDMLKGHAGLAIGPHIINSLFYADDIVLFVSSESVLQDMLNVAAQFAHKWGMTFNSKKSQVMTVGRNFKDSKWQWGDLVIGEAKPYKYLGVMINKHIKDNTHVIDYLAAKANKSESYLKVHIGKTQ